MSMAMGTRPYVKHLLHLCTVTYITEISLHFTFSIQSHSSHSLGQIYSAWSEFLSIDHDTIFSVPSFPEVTLLIVLLLYNVSSVSPACRKRRLNGAVSWDIRIKRMPRVCAWTGTLTNPTKCLWRWEPDRRSNFFFSPPAHLCAVTYMTEISLIVTLKTNSLTHSLFVVILPYNSI